MEAPPAAPGADGPRGPRGLDDRRAGVISGAVVAALAGLVYLVLAPAHVLGGDNAEFATLSATGGVAHPTGYPLYTLYLRALAWLPASSPAHAAALATALLGAAQIATLHAAARAWGARPAAATVAVALYAGGPLPLLLHTQAEVFALNGLIAAAIVYVAADGGPRRGLSRTVTLGLLAGLGLANHASCVLLAPLGLVGAVRGARESGRWPVAVAAGVAALVVGLTPYLALLVAPSAAEGALVWGDLDGAGAVLDHVLRRDYGTFQLGGDAQPVDHAAQLAALGASLGRAWLWAPLALAAWALGRGAWRPRAGDAGRAAWLALAASLVLAGPVFLRGFNIPPVGIGRLIVERFHLLPVLLLVVPVAVGLDHAISSVRARWRSEAPRPWPVGAVAAVGAVVLAASTALSLPGLRAAHSPAVERYLANTLASLPQDALLIGTGDHQVFGFAYLQRARGVRPDVVYLDWELTTHAWYRAQLEPRLGHPVVVEGVGAVSARLVDAALARGRAVFVDTAGAAGSVQARLLATFPSYPYGTVIRLLPRTARPPPLAEVRAENEALVGRFDLRYPRPVVGEGWAALVQARYAQPWHALAAAFAAAGDRQAADELAAVAAALGPAAH